MALWKRCFSLKVQDMFFHGVSFLNWELVPDISRLDLLESVLKDGELMTRDKLWLKHPEFFRCLYNRSYQGNHRVCICCHPSKNDQYAKDSDSRWFKIMVEDAFSNFVYNSYSIILDESLLQDFRFVSGVMVGEFQLLGDISLKYMRGIGMPNDFERLLISVFEILNKNDCFSSREKNDFYVHRLRMIDVVDDFLNEGYFEMGFSHYKKVKKLLHFYGYDVPIVDPETGLEWRSQEDVYKDIVRVHSLAKARRLI